MIPDLKAYLAYVLAKASRRKSIEMRPEGDAWDAAAVRDELWNARDRSARTGARCC